jgi:hypothetical protein
LRRRVRQVLERREDLDVADPASDAILQYLVDKKIVGPRVRSSGRYRGLAISREAGGWQVHTGDDTGLARVSVFQTDIWLACAEIPSTIGVPTPDNVEEVVGFVFQLQLLDATKNSWTSAGHLVNGLRGLTAEHLQQPDNPFLLAAEAPALLRCVLEKDGLLLRELCRFLDQFDTVRRDEVAAALPMIAKKALEAAESLGRSPRTIANGRKLVAKLASAESDSQSDAPGVLEHRSSPRLEWLVDLGLLSKDGLAKNSFEYRVTPRLSAFVELVDTQIGSAEDWPAAVALGEWATSTHWAKPRELVGLYDDRLAFKAAYELLRRPIGPAPLRDVALVSGLLRRAVDFAAEIDHIIELTKRTPGASLSGGRMTRGPENIYLTDEALEALGAQ